MIFFSRLVLKFSLVAILVLSFPVVSMANQALDDQHNLIPKLNNEKQKLKELAGCYPGLKSVEREVFEGQVYKAMNCDFLINKWRKGQDKKRAKITSAQQLTKVINELHLKYFQQGGKWLRHPARERFKACNLQGFGISKNQDRNYSCDILLDYVEARFHLSSIYLNPWLGVNKCHIKKHYIRKQRADGCSLPKELNDPASKHFKKLFRWDCDQHDICYATPGAKDLNSKLANWSRCDRELSENMEATCRSGHNKGIYSPLCRTTAATWVASVIGKGAYDAATEQSNSYTKGQDWAYKNCGKK